jgi:phage terminase large subunit GpA-like protein
MATATLNPQSLVSVIDRIRQGALVRRLRTMREFAEQEIILPSGPYKGERFKADRLPWAGHWMDAVDSGAWRRYLLTGVGQGGKTLAGSALPVMWHLFEHRETVVYGAPTIEMANDKWRQDVLPLIEASAYRDLLPESGKGSKGGTVQSLQFKHGPTLRFMSGGGKDKVRAGFTSRVVVITESDGFDEAGENSRETDRFSQIEARTSAFGDRARVYQECTVSIEEGRTWRELKAGTDSRIVLQCPHCHQFVTPEREHLIGWQDAQNVIEARERAGMVCPACASLWSEQDRIHANHVSRIVHRGQEITPDGSIVGLPPKTLTFALRFTSANNLLVTASRVAEEEWQAPRTTDTALAEKKLRQFYWTLPSESESVTLSELDAQAICNRMVEIERGRVPVDTAKLTIGIDVGKWLCHWVAVAWRADGTPHVVEYGRLEVASSSLAEELAIMNALRRFRDEICKVGWPSLAPNGGTIGPTLTLVDSGNWESTVVTFCNESLAGYLPSKGFGIQQISRRAMTHEPGYELVAQPAGHRLVEINADAWKTNVHARLQTPVGQPGGLTLFKTRAVEHLSFAKHLTSEQKVEEFVAGRGLVSKWKALSRNNHYLDALALAFVAGHGLGASEIAGVKVEVPQPATSYPRERNISVTEWLNHGRNKW